MVEIRRKSRIALKGTILTQAERNAIQSCVRSAMLYGRDACCLGHDEIGIEQRKE